MATLNIGTSHTSPNQNSRPGAPRFIVIHHWGSRGQDFDNVLHWLTVKRSRVSAHYVAQAGRVERIVSEDRRAWHAGSDYGNDYGIGVECRPEATDGDYATVAALVRDIRSRHGDLPLFPHRKFSPGNICPGEWDLDRIDREAGRAAPAVVAGTAPAFPLPRGAGGLYYYGDPDGPITSVSGRGRNSAVPDDVHEVADRWTSDGLRTWQARMDARGYSLEVDGRYGPETERIVRYFQRLVGLAVDGKIGPETWRAAWSEPIR